MNNITTHNTKETHMNKKHRTALKYTYTDKPHQYWGMPGWGQDLQFRIELYSKSKDKLLKQRAELVRDVAKLFAKYGMPTEDFNIQNDWI